MAKKKNYDELDLNLAKKIRTGVLPNGEPKIRVLDEPIPQRNKLSNIKKQVESLEPGKGFAVSITGTSLSNVYHLQKKIAKIIYCYKQKNNEKDFTTSILNDDEVGCWRTK